MQDKRTHRAKLNILTTLIRQLLATLCGIVIPRAMIGAFGSVVYGATTSITQFLSYISLLEGGIGRVARGELYQHLANGNRERISKVYRAIKDFFRNIGIVFIVYAVALAFVYHDIADVTAFSRSYTFWLVIVIALSTMATYFGGISNMTLMHADQRQYLTNTVITVTNVINALSIVVLVKLKADVLTVKLVSSLIFIARPVFYSLYVKKHYKLVCVQKDPTALNQKWTGIGQHIAYFLHTNTDIVLLTLLTDLKLVAVYSVYSLVIKSIWNIASSFSGGMEAAFGEMIAKKEQAALDHSYKYYKFILTAVALVLFGSAAVLLIPFVRIYMADVTDANYIQPLFGLILIFAEFLNCVALPCTTLPISANSLKQTRRGSYGEAIINIALSLVLIPWNPLLGVALGTLVATVFKCVYYMRYCAKKILHCSLWRVFGSFFGSVLLLLAISAVGMTVLWSMPMANMLIWCGYGALTFLLVGCVTGMFCWILFPTQTKSVLRKVLGKK